MPGTAVHLHANHELCPASGEKGGIASVAAAQVNASLAAKVLAEQRGAAGRREGEEPDQDARAAARKRPVSDLLQDERFAALFADGSYAIDEQSEEYKALHPNAGARPCSPLLRQGLHVLHPLGHSDWRHLRSCSYAWTDNGHAFGSLSRSGSVSVGLPENLSRCGMPLNLQGVLYEARDDM